MSAFDRLDPLVQHHIVNTLGWRELRPLQEASIEPVLLGENCLLLAPTAGGKTESAMFPLLSRMCTERWAGPSIIYVCPLKALINNLGERLDRYARMLGRSAAIWHGDIGQGERKQARLEPPDILLTTPESLEGMLISSNPQMKENLRNLCAVVVDEIHAFAGDDRGWHLLSVIQRLSDRTGSELQRIGLSATVGNPKELLEWFVGTSDKPRTVVQPPFDNAVSTEITLDFVGSLENAATVISRLHQGEKRLVFCDSRSRVESLAGLLRSLGVQAFVSHSSLSASERRRAEEAFARGEDCVIVATSTLELGIDVGDLDRVIQIDAPRRVASFLQRLGRTGRRSGKSRNCLFLCTSEESLLQGAALLELWRQGYVEPIVPPPLPYHIVAQQALALCLENGGIGKNNLISRLRNLPPARQMADNALEDILAHMEGKQLLSFDGVRFFIGEEGEMAFGRRNFLELVSVFTSAPMLMVTDGKQELGVVDQNLFFSQEPKQERLLSIAGRGWRVEYVDWKERRVFVSPTDLLGKTTWLGVSAGLSFRMGREIQRVLVSDRNSPRWSQRAVSKLADLRVEFSFLKSDESTLHRGADGCICWYTFAGEATNLALAEACGAEGLEIEKTDDYGISFGKGIQPERLESVLKSLGAERVLHSLSSSREAEEALKFAQCVPADLLKAEIIARRCKLEDLSIVLTEQRRFVYAD